MDAETRRTSQNTLLIVDDEPLITELFKAFMGKRGYRVLSASSGLEALELCEAERNAIRLVITDVSMAQMDGIALAAELGRRLPLVPVILATGHDPDSVDAGDLTNVRAVVRKPYQNRALAEQISDLLDGRHQRS